MEHTERVILTNMCMLVDGTKVLVEDKRSKWADGIIFPGGHVEDKEPIVDSVIREMKEETGLDIEEPRLCGIKEWINEDGSRYIVFLFKTEKFSGELCSSSEGRVFWMEKDDVLKSNWIWHMDGLLRIMADGEYTELFLDTANDWKPVLK
jgi:8-oxo-dGTP diphosphatase